jgi:hypothetical protein
MAKITSGNFRLSGVVAFADNTVTNFHVQGEDPRSFSVAAAESLESTRQVAWYEGTRMSYPFWSAFLTAMNSMGIFGFDYDWIAGMPAVQKQVRDMTLSASFTYTTDDGRTHVAFATYDNGIVNHSTYDARAEGATPTNRADWLTALRTAMLQIMDQVMLW